MLLVPFVAFKVHAEDLMCNIQLDNILLSCNEI